jgi:hypothetical protein
MELSMEIATAAEKIKEQHALRNENTINVTVSEALQNQLANLKTYLIETVQDDTRAVEAVTATDLDDSSLSESMTGEQESATEPVCVDVAARFIFLEEVQALANQVRLTEASLSCIGSLQQTDQFFSEDFLDQCSQLLAQQTNGLEPHQNELRQQLANQEQVFAAARQKLESELVQTFALKNEASLPEVVKHTEALRNDLEAFQQKMVRDFRWRREIRTAPAGGIGCGGSPALRTAFLGGGYGSSQSAMQGHGEAADGFARGAGCQRATASAILRH